VMWKHQICYYGDKEDVCNDEKCKGYLLSENIKAVGVPKDKPPTRFDIHLEGVDRLFELQAPSEEVARQWINTIQSVMIDSRGGKAVAVAKGEGKYWKPLIHRRLMQRRQAIMSSEAVPFMADLAARKYDKTPEAEELIYEAIAEDMAFRIMDDEEKREVVKNMWRCEYSKKDPVIAAGDPMYLFFVVVSGSFDYIHPEESKAGDGAGVQVLTRGSTFGQLALLYESTSSHTVTAREDSVCYVLDRAHYKKMMTAASERHFEQRVNLLKSSPIFGQLPVDIVKKMAEALEERSFMAGEIIMRQDHPSEAFYMLLSGSALAVRDGKEVKRYTQAGEYFGERSLIGKSEKATATIHATSALTVLYMSSKDFVSLMGTMEESVNDKGVRKYSVLNREILVPEPGKTPEDLPPPPAEVEAKTLEPEAKEEAKAARVCPVKSKDELIVIGTLGRGTFGHVQLVKDRNDVTYALKAVNKAHVVTHNQIPHILNERAVMMELDHPFVVHLYGTMKDRDYLYFLLEPSLGGGRFSLLNKHDRFESNTARFYAAIVVSIFQYMHSLNILYRDLKPENLLLDEHGYIKMTDFGFAKKTKERTYTFCGTPDYLAPEIVASAGHHTGADWWTLGILIYEMLAGYTPFFDNAGPTSMYSKILAGKLAFPSHFTPQECDIIQSLLQTKPTRRLGVVLGGAEVVKKHPWFEGIDWNALLERKIPAPIAMNIKDKFDLSNFDVYPDDEAPPCEEYVVDPNNPDWDNVF